MGYMTTISILNDGFHCIAKHPQELVDAISEGMNGMNRQSIFKQQEKEYGVSTFYVGNGGNNTLIAPAFHADDQHVFLVGQNFMYNLNKCYGFTDERTLNFQLQAIETAMSLLETSKKLLLKNKKEIEQK